LKKNSLYKIAIFWALLRILIFWEASLTFVVDNVYLVSLVDLTITVLLVITTFFGEIKNRNLFYYGILMSCFLLGQGCISILLLDVPSRYFDVLICTWYFTLPFFFWSFIPANKDMEKFITRFLEIMLVYFIAQTYFMPLLGYQFGVQQAIYANYGFFTRSNNTFGGGTAGTQIISFLLINYMSLIYRSCAWNKLRKTLVFLAMLSIFLSMSRSGWIFLIFLAIFLFSRRHTLSIKKIIACFSIFIFLMVLLFASRESVFVKGLAHVVEARLTNPSYDTLVSDRSRLERIFLAKEVFFNRRTLTQLLGTGFGTSYARTWHPVGTKPLFPKTWNIENQDTSRFYSGAPHNTYIVLLNELGFLGISAWILFSIILLILPVLRNLQTDPDQKSLFILAMLTLILVYLNTETIFFTPKYGYPFVMLLWAFPKTGKQ